MSKKNKNNTSKPKAIADSLKNIGSLITKSEKILPDVDSQPLKNIDVNKANLSKENEIKIGKFITGLDTLLNEVSSIKNSINNELNNTKNNKEKSEKEIIEAQEKVGSARKEENFWKKKNSEFSKIEEEQAQLKRELIEKEEEAKNGFSKLNMEFVELLSKDKESLEGEINLLKININSLSTEFESNKKEAEEKWNNEFENIKIEKTSELEALEVSVLKKQTETDILAAQNKIQKEAIESSIEEQVSIKSIDVLKSNEYLKERTNSLATQLTDKQKEIDQFKDLNHLLDGESPESILAINKSLKKKVFELNQEINSSPGGGLQDSYDELQEEFEALGLDVQENEREISKLKNELHRKKLYISEQGYSQKMLEAAELHADMYGVQVQQLKEELDSLKEKDKDKQTFKALSEYDEKHKRSVPVYGKDEHETLKDFVIAVRHQMAIQEGLLYPLETLQIFVAGLAMSRLHILQGISGTGKTSLATSFAKVVNGIDESENEKGLQVVAIQAGWRDGQDLLGYFNAFENRYYETDFLKGLYQAQTPEFQDQPYIILLDEMNLSHPEQYFSDFLSKLELKEASQIISLTSSSVPNAPKALIDGSKIKIPKNVWFIGTANHDETTMEFADKTYDRSHVMELPRNKPDEFPIDNNKKYNWTFDNLDNAFKEAEKTYRKEVDIAHGFLEDIAKDYLDKSFDVGFGNRLKRQLNSFVPVVIETGGSLEMAIDHILCTKLLRKGKVIDRFDTTETQIKELKEGIDELWKLNEFMASPKKSYNLLDKELQRQSRR